MRYVAAHAGRLGYTGNRATGRVIGRGAVEGRGKTLGLRR